MMYKHKMQLRTIKDQKTAKCIESSTLCVDQTLIGLELERLTKTLEKVKRGFRSNFWLFMKRFHYNDMLKLNLKEVSIASRNGFRHETWNPLSSRYNTGL